MKTKPNKRELIETLESLIKKYPPQFCTPRKLEGVPTSMTKAYKEFLARHPEIVKFSDFLVIYTPGKSPKQMAEQIIQGKNTTHKLTIPKGVGSKGTGKRTGTDDKDKYRKKSCSPKLTKSPIDKGRQGLKQTQMRLDDSDRLMATARCPEYIEDWNEFISELGKGTTNLQTIKTFLEKLCRKWELKSPIYPYLSKKGEDSKIFEVNRREAILELTEDEWPNSLCISLSKPIGKCVFVRLRIDLTRSEKELKKYFGQMIKAWKRDIPKERKARKTKFDPWEIYNMHKVDGHKFPKIAEILYERDRKSNEFLYAYKQYFERVNAAYSRAEDMINQVSKEAKMR